MKKKQKIVFIDSDINIKYINRLLSESQSIGGVWRILKNQVTPLITHSLDTLSHATLCTKMFLKHTTCSCELFFINIWEDDEINTNINALLVALSWCLENDVTLINLSLGTTYMEDISELFSIINKLVEKNIIIVAAASNMNQLTFPASFDHVIGVKALDSKSGKIGFIYQETSLDLIEISCNVEDEVITYKNQQYFLCVSNSLAAPVISAKICNYLNEGYNSIEKITMKLKEDASHNQDDKIYENYFTQKIEIPVIAIISNHFTEDFDMALFIQNLLLEFSKQGYQGICLSDNKLSNISEQILNLMDFENYTPIEKLHFYAHYCNIDYVMVEGSKEFLFGDLKTEDFDIILHHSELKHAKEITEAPSITFSKRTNLSVLFNQIYSYLSE